MVERVLKHVARLLATLADVGWLAKRDGVQAELPDDATLAAQRS